MTNRSVFVFVSALLAGALAWPGCTRVEDHEGGLFAPFPDGVASQAGDDGEATGGGSTIELPDASEFVPDEEITESRPLIVDTGGPPAVVHGDDDSAEMEVEPATETPAVEVMPPDDGLAAEPPTPEPPTQAPPVYTPVAVPYEAPPQPVHEPSAVGLGGNALAVSTPLSDIVLVAAIPESTPPRAIVRFPNNDERVVQIGDMLGEDGAKVIFIGDGFIKLAELQVNQPDNPTIVQHIMHRSR